VRKVHPVPVPSVLPVLPVLPVLRP